MTYRHAILATAGHIDHGKSALVKALSGDDPDRLPEEKLRGITIDLGFAHLELPGHSLGIVDVPGHQDFVKNMVAGVGAVDLALLVVAADDGWMPQTEEHLQILSYLGATRGVVALTKVDLVDDTAARENEIRQQLQNSPLADAAIIPVSAHNGTGLEELKTALTAAAGTMPPHTDDGQPRLAVDRVFTLQGIGTVVTGTLTGGILSKGDTVTAHPPGRDTRIRTLQSHNRAQDTAQPGTRTALNLADAARGDLPRGATITLPALAATTRTLDVLLERSARLGQECAPLRNDTRVRVHHGSAHWPARLVLLEGKTLAPGATQLAQLRLEQPTCVWPGDRIVIRNWPESATLAGGRVLDAQGDRLSLRSATHKLFLQTRAAAPNDTKEWIRSQLTRDGVARRDALLRPSTFSSAEINAAVTALTTIGTTENAGDWMADAARWKEACAAMAAAVNAEHRAHPERPGLELEALRPLSQKAFPIGDVFSELLEALCQNGFKRQAKYLVALSHKPALPPHLRTAGEKIRNALAEADPPARKILAGTSEGSQALRFLIEAGEVVEVSPELALGAAQFNRFRLLLKKYLRANGKATASELRQALGTTRRILIPLLEKLDRDGVTMRQGDVRVLRPEK
jgi:selenocysteine-specific elongation factor